MSGIAAVEGGEQQFNVADFVFAMVKCIRLVEWVVFIGWLRCLLALLTGQCRKSLVSGNSATSTPKIAEIPLEKPHHSSRKSTSLSNLGSIAKLRTSPDDLFLFACPMSSNSAL